MPVQGESLVVTGLKPLLKAAKDAGTAVNKEVRDALRASGEIVRADASGHLGTYSSRSAAGLKVRVRQRGVAVEQSLRKTTGLHPEYGKLQMRILLGALYGKETEVGAEFEKALDKVARIFNE